MANANVQFLSRECKVVRKGEDKECVLVVRVAKPELLASGTVEVSAHVSCPHFSETARVQATDEIQAIVFSLNAVRGILLGKVREGYEMWWLAPGDLNFADFWAYKP